MPVALPLAAIGKHLQELSGMSLKKFITTL